MVKIIHKKEIAMAFQTKIQLINRKQSRQWYVNFPSACAQMMDFQKGEVVEWVVTPAGDLVLKRPNRIGESDEKQDI